MNTARKFWETCGDGYAHLTAGKFKQCVKWYTDIFSRMDLAGKTVIDYGCGGGWTGKLLFDRFKIGKYIGLDIAKRSVITSKTVLAGYNAEFHLIPIDFKGLGADVFVSLACIQHFPDEKFFTDFLRNIDESGIETLMLQIRGDKTTEFINQYDAGGNIGLCCVTNVEYILKHMKNYDHTATVDPRTESRYQFLFFSRKK